VLGYQTSNSGLLGTFHSARQALRDGGIFLFDFWYGPAVMAEKPSVRVKRIRDKNREVIRIAEPQWDPRACTVSVNYQILARNLETGLCQDSSELHKVRYFFEPELENVLAQSGFAPLAWGEWMTHDTPSPKTWGVYCIARAI
jgi:hypothetical protein